MKRIVIALLLVLIAGTAGAQTIYDIQTGMVPENTIVQLANKTVVAVRYNGIYVSEAPHGMYNGIWVYGGNAFVGGFAEGDVVNIEGEYYEYFDLSEVDVQAGLVQLVSTGGPVPPPSVVPAAELVDPLTAEPWESCQITIPDQGYVTVLPSSYGEWFVTYGAGDVMFDDYWYDDSTVALDDCYEAATGILNYNFGSFKLEPFETGIDFCPVSTEESTFGGLKALYR